MKTGGRPSPTERETGGLMPAEMMDDLAYQLAGRFDKAGFQIFIRLVRLIDRAGAKHQRRADCLDKRRFGAVVDHVRLRAEQFSTTSTS